MVKEIRELETRVENATVMEKTDAKNTYSFNFINSRPF